MAVVQGLTTGPRPALALQAGSRQESFAGGAAAGVLCHQFMFWGVEEPSVRVCASFTLSWALMATGNVGPAAELSPPAK